MFRACIGLRTPVEGGGIENVSESWASPVTRDCNRNSVFDATHRTKVEASCMSPSPFDDELKSRRLPAVVRVSAAPPQVHHTAVHMCPKQPSVTQRAPEKGLLLRVRP